MFCNIRSTFKLSTFAKNMQSLYWYMHYLYLYQFMITVPFCRKYSIQHVQPEFFFFGLRKGKKQYIYIHYPFFQDLDDLHKNKSQISFKIYSFLV